MRRPASRSPLHRAAGLAAAGLLVAGLAACGETNRGYYEADIRHYPSVTEKTLEASLGLQAGQESLTGGQQAELAGLVADWRRRAMGAMQITLAAPADTAGPMAGAVRAYLTETERLDASAFTISVAEGDGAARADHARMTVRYRGAVVKVSDCNASGTDLSFNPWQAENPNFGCATYRNLGLMVVDPRDLKAPPRSPARSAPAAASVEGFYGGGGGE